MFEKDKAECSRQLHHINIIGAEREEFSNKKTEPLKFCSNVHFVLHKGYNENLVYSSCQAEEEQKKEKNEGKEKARPPGKKENLHSAKTAEKERKGKKTEVGLLAPVTVKKDTQLKRRGEVEEEHKYIGM